MGADGEHWEIGHFQDVLGIAAVACQERTSATMCIDKRATHFAKMSRPHILTTVKAEGCTVFKVINGPHHSFLGMPTLCLPFCLLSFYVLRESLLPVPRNVFDRQDSADQLHPLRRSLNRSEKTVSHIPRLF